MNQTVFGASIRTARADVCASIRTAGADQCDDYAGYRPDRGSTKCYHHRCPGRKHQSSSSRGGRFGTSGYSRLAARPRRGGNIDLAGPTANPSLARSRKRRGRLRVFDTSSRVRVVGRAVKDPWTSARASGKTSSRGSSLSSTWGDPFQRRSPWRGASRRRGSRGCGAPYRTRSGRGSQLMRLWTLKRTSPSPWTTSTDQIAVTKAAAKRSENP